MKWELYSFVSRSKQRTAMIKVMDNPITPTDIAKKAKLNKSHVSRSLKEFVERGIAECLTPNERVGKFYQLTVEGKKVLEKINEK